jgi:hypothetical protein
MKTQRAFRPVIDDGRLEERVVMTRLFFPPALFFAVPTVPQTTNTFISHVGVAIYQDYGAAITVQRQITTQLVNVLSPGFQGGGPATAADVSALQSAVNRTVNNLNNLVTGLTAATRNSIFGNSPTQPSLISQLTAPGTALGDALGTFAPGGVPISVGDAAGQVPAAVVFGNLGVWLTGVDPTGGAATLGIADTIGNSNVQAQLLLAAFVRTGTAAGDFHVIPI